MGLPEITFEEFPKMARLSRECVITEKLDGTNAQIIVTDDYRVAAASRNRLITPENDNYGFAQWVHQNKNELVQLGPGRHFGEWWGLGIQRGYKLHERRFSLFNAGKWHMVATGQTVLPDSKPAPSCCHVVPVLYVGNFDTLRIDAALTALGALGSKAAPGFMKPEGIVIYHTAARFCFKKTLEGDQPKGAQR